MKRITCISGLAVMLLISCTIISFFIERQMLPQAILAESRPVEGEHEKILLPSPAVKEDGGGTYVLMAETGDDRVVLEPSGAAVYCVSEAVKRSE